MDKITFHSSPSKKKEIKVHYRLRDGRNVQLSYSSDIVANVEELAKLNPDGSRKDRVTVYNRELAQKLAEEYKIMQQAYAVMCDKGLDMTSKVFEQEIRRIKEPVVQIRAENPSIVARFRQYADDALRGHIIGEDRHKHIIVVVEKLERFLIINGIRSLTTQEFTDAHLMDFRNFLFDEYQYVKKNPKLYGKMSLKSLPQARLSVNTVTSQLKMFQSFFNEMENIDEIQKSPFRKLGKEKRKTVMKTLYDEPFFLRKDELLKIINTDVPALLQDTKDAFVVQCAFGCRISDFQIMSIKTIAVSDEGIPYIHYIPLKTADRQGGNIEVETPIVRYAFDIIKRTGFSFPILRNVYGPNGYNASIKYLLSVCKIDREVKQYNEETKQYDYMPLCKVASSKLARKTHVDIMNKVQIDQYVAGLHKVGSSAVNRYTSLEIRDKFALMNVAFDQKPYRVNKSLFVI